MSKFIIFGGGGKVALKFAKLASAQGHTITSVVRNHDHDDEITSAGAQPHLLSLEDASVQEISTLFKDVAPKAVIFAAGAGGKGGVERTKAVDYEGALKVFDAAEATNTHRVLVVSAIDLRDPDSPFPPYYDEESKRVSERMHKAIGPYMKYKLLADNDLQSRKSLRWTILRPAGLTDEGDGGAEIGDVQLRTTSRETVAKLLLLSALEPAAQAKVFNVIDGKEKTEEAFKKALDV